MIKHWLGVSLVCFALAAFLPKGAGRPPDKEKLSEYGFFSGKMALQVPQAGVQPYQLNTPLFSDYAEKLRFVYLPPGTAAQYHPTEVLDFPAGTVLIKTFYYPIDFRQPGKGRRLIETRLLINEGEAWQALTYVWNDDQTEALLEVAGDTKKVAWINPEGKKQQLDYQIPNVNQCKGCHNMDEQLRPIGPTARQLNGSLDHGPANQLAHWQAQRLLQGLPDLAQVPRAPVWDNARTGSLAERARAYLDINCAHCHRSTGPAKTSGLLLDWQEQNPTKLGIFKTPVAAGKGSGNLQYDIVPQKPEASILLYRLHSTDPGERMPELGRQLVHREGMALIKEWIKSL